MASRTEKLRRRQHRKDKKRQRASGNGSVSVGPGDLLVGNPTRQFKMSDALMAIIQPEWNGCEGEEAMRKLLMLGVVGWNAALMTGAERTAFLEKLGQTLPNEMREDFKQMVDLLIRRKEERFRNVHRPILSFELTCRPSGDPYLTVMSGLN